MAAFFILNLKFEIEGEVGHGSAVPVAYLAVRSSHLEVVRRRPR